MDSATSTWVTTAPIRRRTGGIRALGTERRWGHNCCRRCNWARWHSLLPRGQNEPTPAPDAEPVRDTTSIYFNGQLGRTFREEHPPQCFAGAAQCDPTSAGGTRNRPDCTHKQENSAFNWCPSRLFLRRAGSLIV